MPQVVSGVLQILLATAIASRFSVSDRVRGGGRARHNRVGVDVKFERQFAPALALASERENFVEAFLASLCQRIRDQEFTVAQARICLLLHQLADPHFRLPSDSRRHQTDAANDNAALRIEHLDCVA